MYNFSLLRKNNLFKDLSDEELSDIMKHFTTTYIRKNTNIFFQKDTIDHIYIIINGRVEVNKHDLDGTKSIITILGRYDVFGESIALSTNQISPYNSMTLEDSTIGNIEHDSFIEMTLKYPKLLTNMVEVLANKNTFMTFKLECLSKRNIQEKVFEVLRYYSIIQKSYEIELPFNKSQLAEFLFINRSALSRELSKMQSEGIFRYENKVYYLNEKYFE